MEKFDSILNAAAEVVRELSENAYERMVNAEGCETIAYRNLAWARENMPFAVESHEQNVAYHRHRADNAVRAWRTTVEVAGAIHDAIVMAARASAED